MEDGAVAALHSEFIPNWTSEQFRDFVRNLASLTDDWAKKSDPKDVEVSKTLWSRVLTLEAKFWPDVSTQA
jgi:thiaminase